MTESSADSYPSCGTKITSANPVHRKSTDIIPSGGWDYRGSSGGSWVWLNVDVLQKINSGFSCRGRFVGRLYSNFIINIFHLIRSEILVQGC
jgi:hypothetical protein